MGVGAGQTVRGERGQRETGQLGLSGKVIRGMSAGGVLIIAQSGEEGRWRRVERRAGGWWEGKQERATCAMEGVGNRGHGRQGEFTGMWYVVGGVGRRREVWRKSWGGGVGDGKGGKRGGKV